MNRLDLNNYIGGVLLKVYNDNFGMLLKVYNDNFINFGITNIKNGYYKVNYGARDINLQSITKTILIRDHYNQCNINEDKFRLNELTPIEIVSVIGKFTLYEIHSINHHLIQRRYHYDK